MTKPILECNGIAAGYVKGLNILQGVDVVVNEGEIVSIIGPNGAGKSTLLNMIQPNLNIHTQEVSEQHQQGQHTTTFSEMHDLDFGASIIDTPGVRGFGLIEMDKYELGDYFIEFFKLKPECKFNNCLHINEPKCAVKLALEKGQIAPSRYKNYLNMLEQDDESFRINRYEK